MPVMPQPQRPSHLRVIASADAPSPPAVATREAILTALATDCLTAPELRRRLGVPDDDRSYEVALGLLIALGDVGVADGLLRTTSDAAAAAEG